MPTYELYIPNMVCPACVAPVNALKELKQVKSVTPNFVGHVVIVESDETQTTDDKFIEEMQKQVDDIGFTCETLLETTPSTLDPDIESKQIAHELKKRTLTKKLIRSYWIKGMVGVLSGLGLLALSIFGVGIPLVGMMAIGGISTLLTLYFGKETYQQAAFSLIKAKTLSMDSLFSVSTILALGISCVSLFVPGLPMLFEAALLILGFKNVGKAIEESVKNEMTQKSFRSSAPPSILTQLTPELSKEIAIANLRPGNIIIVKKGQIVPVDGICLSKNKTIYNTIVTGRTVPQFVTTNDCIYAGCKVPDDVDYIKIRVTKNVANSYLAFLDNRIKLAEQEKERSKIEVTAEKSLKYFIPIVFGIAIISAIFVGAFLSPLAAVQCAISVLVSACPCTLGLVTPLAIKTGMAKAASKGVSFKNGKSIDAAADIDTVVFDLNGTLTTGVIKVTKSHIPRDIWPQRAKIESLSSHPIAKAIHQFALEKNYPLKEFKDFSLDKSHHAGISAEINSETFDIGNSELMATKKIATTKYDAELKKTNAEHIIYIAKNKNLIGYILLEDPLRDDAIATISELKKQGKKIHICTGADPITTQKYANKLGIPPENICAKCVGDSKDESANSKTKYIRHLMSQGHKVAMVGDAANDVTAVATSHFGIAVASASGNRETQANAAAVINQGSLWSIVNAFSIANQTINNIKQNLWISIGYNLTTMIAFSGLLVAIGFAVNPALGAALMILQTGIILMNVERFKRQATPLLTKTLVQSTNPVLQSTDGYLTKSVFKTKKKCECQPCKTQAIDTRKPQPDDSSKPHLLKEDQSSPAITYGTQEKCVRFSA